MTSEDVTGVFDKDFNQKFVAARPMKASVMRDSKVMQQPLEDGSSFVDHRIINMIEIEILMYLTGEEYKAVYAQIATSFLNGDMFIVQTKMGSYPSMIIESIPHEETPDMMDVVALSMKLQEARFAKTTFSPIAPRKTSNASKVKRGETAGGSSVAYDVIFGKKK